MRSQLGVAVAFLLVATYLGTACLAAPLYLYRFAVSDSNCTGYPTSVSEYPETCSVSPLSSSFYHQLSCDIHGIPSQRVCTGKTCAAATCSETVSGSECRRSGDGVTVYQIGCENLALPYKDGEVRLNYYKPIVNASEPAICPSGDLSLSATLKRCDYIGNNKWMRASCSGFSVTINTCSDDLCSENCEAQTFAASSCQAVNGFSVTATCLAAPPAVSPDYSSLQYCNDTTTCPSGEICFAESMMCVRDCAPKVTHTSFSQYKPGVGIFRFSLRECTGMGLPILNREAVAQKKQLIIRERVVSTSGPGAQVSSAETNWLLKNDGVPGNAVTVILVDLSSSVKTRFENLTYSVNEFIEAVISDSLPQQVSVLFFDGSANTTSILSFTENLGNLRETNRALLSHVVTDISTNLYGAIVSGVKTLENKFLELGPSYSYNLVIFSDGQDEAYRVSDLRAVDVVSYPISRQMRLQVSSVLVGGVANAPFLSSLGSVHTFMNSPNITSIIRLAASARNEESFYKVAYCTAKRAGVWTSSLSLAPVPFGGNFGSERLLMNMKLDATGFEACDVTSLQDALSEDAVKYNRYDPPKIVVGIISGSSQVLASIAMSLLAALVALLV